MKIKIPEPAPTRVTSIYVRRIEGTELVTVIELLSPANKHPGKNRQKYEQKRFSFLDSYYTHFVEIDLLRRDPRMLYQGELPKPIIWSWSVELINGPFVIFGRLEYENNCQSYPSHCNSKIKKYL
ncbi:conserved hypothetical protein [Beggiatoa sp. PS]|nr:conserved hypothetical protein [Beggiatoa sp. PS]